MKSLLSVALAFAAAVVVSAAVPTPTEEKEVMAALDAWIKATVTQDTAALQKILHDELMYSHSDTRTQTKAEVIKDVQDGRGSAAIELSDTIVRVYGNSALVKAKVVVRGRGRGARAGGAAVPGAAAGGGGQAPAPLSILHVLVKGPAGWQLVSRTATRPPAPAPVAAR